MDSTKLNIKHNENVVLAEYTTFHLGGKCEMLYYCQTPDELTAVVTFLVNEAIPFILIGGGSNLVVSDKGVNCHVIRYVSEKPIIQKKDTDLTVSGSTNLDALVSYAAQQGLEGLNYASGIPGTVGGAVVGNAGAFGQQVGDVLSQAVLLTRQGERKILTKENFQFSYRNSILKETKDIVVEVTFSLQLADSNKLLKQRQQWLELRHQKHPDPENEPCAGSFFRNVEPTSKADKRQAAAWFLDQAGALQLHKGNACVSEKHANMIINKDKQATAQDVYELSKEMAKIVKNKYDLDLVREVQLVGKFDGMPEGISNIIW